MEISRFLQMRYRKSDKLLFFTVITESPFVRLPVISLVAFIVAQLFVVLKSSSVKLLLLPISHF